MLQVFDGTADLTSALNSIHQSWATQTITTLRSHYSTRLTHHATLLAGFPLHTIESNIPRALLQAKSFLKDMSDAAPTILLTQISQLRTVEDTPSTQPVISPPASQQPLQHTLPVHQPPASRVQLNYRHTATLYGHTLAAHRKLRSTIPTM